METRLALLERRRDRVTKLGKWLLLAFAFFWCAGILAYDMAADPPVARENLLLPARLDHALLQANLVPVDIRRIWGGRGNSAGLLFDAAAMLLIGIVALAKTWLNRRRFSRPGLGFVLLSFLLFYLLAKATAPLAWPAFLRADQFATLTRHVERAQPGMIAAIRAGERLDLPEEIDPSKPRSMDDLVTVRAGPGLTMQDVAGPPPIRDLRDAEALRFALAEQAWIAGNRDALRRLLPLRFELRTADSVARADFARRLAAMEEAAGKPALTGAGRAWMVDGAASWAWVMRFVHLNRYVINLLVGPALAAWLIGLILRRRVKKIVRHLASAAGTVPESAPPPPGAAPSFGRAGARA